MLIKWLGHSCFKLTLNNGKNILIDPYDHTVGYASVNEQADVVLITHHHHDHDCASCVIGDFETIDAAGEYEACGAKITGIKAFHDNKQGAERGEIVVYKIEADGLCVVHLGDIGEVPGDEFFEKLGKVDVLMVPVGGVYTVDAKADFELVNKIKSNITIPMHYMTADCNLKLSGIHEFLELVGEEFDKSRLGHSTIEVHANDLKKRQRIMIMEYANEK